jgi:L-ribulokinase
MHGAVAAGTAAGGYDTIFEATRKMAHLQMTTYRPRKREHEVYDRIFEEYQVLHDYFGRGTNDVMKRLKALQAEQASH